MIESGRLFIALIIWIFVSFPTSAQIQLNNFGAGLSYWHRNYNGIDERAFFINYQPEAPFRSGALMPTVSAEVNIINELALDGRIGLLSFNFTGEGTSEQGAIIREQIDQRIIPLTVGGVYTFRHVLPDIFNAFVGAGMNRYYIRNSMERIVYNAGGSLPTQTFTGNNAGFYGKIGVEYMVVPQLGLALEGRYNSGSYNQVRTIGTTGSQEPVKVSLQGLEVGIGIRYSLLPMFGRRYRY
jgi:outer membrane protein W